MCQGFCNDEVFSHDVDHGRNVKCSWAWLACSALPAVHGTSVPGLKLRELMVTAMLDMNIQLHDINAVTFSADAGQARSNQANLLFESI